MLRKYKWFTAMKMILGPVTYAGLPPSTAINHVVGRGAGAPVVNTVIVMQFIYVFTKSLTLVGHQTFFHYKTICSFLAVEFTVGLMFCYVIYLGMFISLKLLVNVVRSQHQKTAGVNN